MEILSASYEFFLIPSECDGGIGGGTPSEVRCYGSVRQPSTRVMCDVIDAAVLCALVFGHSVQVGVGKERSQRPLAHLDTWPQESPSGPLEAS